MKRMLLLFVSAPLWIGAYRSLENAGAPSTQKFVEQKNALTLGYLDKLPGSE